jgi:hypothetical protein
MAAGLLLDACSSASLTPSAPLGIEERAPRVAVSPSLVSQVTPPPAREVTRLGLSSFYRKYVSAGGLPVVASERVSDYALREAGYLALRVLHTRPDVLQALIDSRLRVVVMAYDEMLTEVPEHSELGSEYWDGRARGLGPRKEDVAVSSAEENLLAFPGDPYEGENVFIHEFAHAIAEKALPAIHPSFETRLKDTYEQARRTGLWKGAYAATSPEEYWAELVQIWFDTNHENGAHHNHVNTREELVDYDPAGATLVDDFLGNNDFRYIDPRKRRPLGHLQGLDRSALPTFSWPPHVVRLLQPLPAGEWRQKRSARRGPAATIHFDNQRNETVVLFWIDLDGKLERRGWISARSEFVSQTQVDHCFLVTDKKEEPLAAFCAELGLTRAIIARYW